MVVFDRENRRARLNELAQKAQNRIDDWRKSGVVARRKAEEENREKRVKKTEEFKAALAQKERQRQEIYALNRLMKLEEDKAVEIYRRQVADRKRRDAASGGGATWLEPSRVQGKGPQVKRKKKT